MKINQNATVILKWLLTTRLLSIFRKKILKSITYLNTIIGKSGVVLFVCYNDPKKIKILNLINQIKKETEMLLDDIEALQLFLMVKGERRISGDIAEVGVYKGGSAKLLCEAKADKYLHLFDTFTGLPEPGSKDDLSQFQKGKYLAPFEKVKKYLRGYSKVKFYKGNFPETAKSVKNKKFSFVNLDVDIYKSTLESLNFFYPRMNKGGMIISHDYEGSMGVRKAFNHFLKDKPEPLIVPAGGSQSIIIKI